MQQSTRASPMTSPLTLVRYQWQIWLQRRHPRGPRAQRLTQNRVYIFLSYSGLAFCVMLLIMLGGAINYDLALAYLFVFLLAAMAIASIFHTFRNLLGLELAPGRVVPCFAGENARFEIVLNNNGRLARHHLRLSYGQSTGSTNVAAGDTASVWLSMPTQQRGWLVAPRLKIETHWPIGVFRTWSYAFFDQRVLVYPQPESDPPSLPTSASGSGEGIITPLGHDDFAGLRPFHRGDSPRHVAWKSAVREGELMVKVFHGSASRSLWLAWADLPDRLDTEHKLSRLSAWVLAAEAEGLAYGLSLPGTELAPNQGEAHCTAALTALALFAYTD